MPTILVLSGGDSDEREVSLRSGAAVSAALRSSGYSVIQFDPSKPLTKDIVAASDVVFPVLHGKGGEDGVVQALLESFGSSYVGSGVEASQLCFDKAAYKAFLTSHDIRCPKGALVTATSLREHPLSSKPFVLKPYDGGSSVDTYIVRSVSEADWPAMDASCAIYDQMLLEELIQGTEITIAVVGDQTLPVIEIIPPDGGEFDYENKYNGQSQELCPPLHIAEAIQVEAQALAYQIHTLIDCRDISRTDMMVSENGELYVLETNTMPGLTDQSLVPKAAVVSGITMSELTEQLVNLALNRKNG